jgi:hypothetical protein
MAGERWLTEQKRSGIVRAFTLNDREQYPAIHGGANGCFQFGARPVWVEDGYRPLSDIQELELEAGKLPFIRDGARYAWLECVCVGWGRVVEPVSHTRVGVHNTGPPVFPYVLKRM